MAGGPFDGQTGFGSGLTVTPTPPGFIPQPSIGDFDGRFAQAARDSAGRDPLQGLSGIQRQIMLAQQGQQGQQQPFQTTGQQITDPATGRNFTIGGPMTQDMDTGLAYQRAMEAFNQSNQQNQQPGGQSQQVGQINPGAANQMMQARLRPDQQAQM